MKLNSKFATAFILLLFGISTFPQEVVAQRSKADHTSNYQTKSQSSTFVDQAVAPTLYTKLKLLGEKFSNPERNFNSSLLLKYAGDINRDGKADFYYNVNAPDETTDNLEDRISKTVILYGSTAGLVAENSIVVRGNYNFISDLTGDDQPESIQNINDTLYLVKDESSGTMDDLKRIKLFTVDSNYEYSSHGDLDGDGYNDLLVYGTEINPSEPSENYLIYGANTLDSISIDTLAFSAKENAKNTEYNRIAYSDLDNDGQTELIQAVSGLDINDEAYGFVNIGQINSSGELELVVQKSVSDHITLPWAMQSGALNVVDLISGNNKEIVLFSRAKANILTYTSEGELDSQIYSPLAAPDVEGFSMLNDIDGDGINELMFIGSNEVKIVRYSISDGHLISESLPIEAGEQVSPPENVMQLPSSGSDVDGDGIDDLVVGFTDSKTGTKGYRVYFSNGDYSFNDFNETEIEETERRNINSVSTIGDVNADGILDYAVSYEATNTSLIGISHIHIYFGGSFDSLPEEDLILESETVYNAPRYGDFNGDGVSDLIISQSASNQDDIEAKIDIYFGGSSIDAVPDQTIYSSELYPVDEIKNIGNINSIGDINNDGFDDIAMTSEDEFETTKIIFGGTTLSKSVDLELPYFSSEFISVGDFDEDGVDDFATNKLLEDRIFIHLGYDETSGETFELSPHLAFTVPQQDAATNGMNETKYFGHFMVSGDFDGDGVKDLAAKSIFSSNMTLESENSETWASIFIFKGGVNTDSLVDATISLSSKYFAKSNSQLTDNNETLYQALGSIAAVPDQNGDGTDEILFASSFYAKNAGVFYGGDLDTMGASLGVLLEGPNSELGLGPAAINYTSANNGYPALGDFDGDGYLDVLLPQYRDYNFRVDPVYLYSFEGKLVGLEEESTIVSDFRLHQNYPNPFNPVTKIRYSIPQSDIVKLQVFDITGRLVSTLINERQFAGSYTQNFDASDLASGIYIYRLQTTDYNKTQKMLLIK